ncbi:RNA polymerase sigma factor [Cytophagales bacterium LB-30]|uniref:RNA polymerase sigma factor n=1 Tax=Shiella aurantiaca TaxID=3058365 RepID=A0ABT8F5S9_9BACT|nr:RNA polymerase sigma factor [Shiella aurantiaca]MDN4165321.1 RNA polymerase sigma factor [Shiella aurantiaca]
MKDSEILDRIRKGDEQALDFLYKKHYRMMQRLVTSNNGSEEEAKDIFQDALIAFWQKVIGGEFVLTSRISTYLYSICQNLWRKELDRKSRLSHEEKDGEVFMQGDQQEKARIIHQCIEDLGDTCKKILTYYYFDGRSMDEIAELMGFANSDTAKTKKYKCKQKLDSLVKSKYSANDFLD